jgi:hypothetical protein
MARPMPATAARGPYAAPMRTSLLLLALLLPLTAPAAESVTFAWAPRTGGESVTQTEATGMAFAIDLFAGDNKLGTVQTRNDETGTLTAKLGKWTPKKRSATLSYGPGGSKQVQTTPDGKQTTEEQPRAVANSTYTVTAAGGGEPVITKAGGAAVSAEEREAVLEDWNELAATGPAEFESAIAGRTMTVGQEVSSEPGAVAAMLDIDGDGLSLQSASIKLVDVRDDAGERCGVFAMEVVIQGTDPEVSMTMNVKGEAVVAVDSLRTHSVTLQGPVAITATMEEQGMAMRMAGGGDFSFALSYTYGE